MIEAGLSQSLIDLLRRPARARAADARLRAAAARAVGEALDVLRKVEGVYAHAQAVDAHLGVLEQQRSLVKQLVEVAEARHAAGEAGQLDVIRLRAGQAAFDAERIQRQADRRALRLSLARLIGRPSGGTRWQLEPLASPPSSDAAESAWISAALENRPQVQAALFKLAALGAETRLASLEPFDDLAVGAELESEEDFSVGPAASVPVPIFDWGRHRRAHAEAEVIASRHRLTAARREVVEDVRLALAAVDAAKQAVEAVENQLLPLQRERVEQTRAAFRAGFADVMEVLEAEQDLLDAQARLIDARLARQIAAADLKRAAGGIAATPDTASQPTTTRTSR